MVDLLTDPSRKIVAYYNLESRIDRAANDLRALTTLMLCLGKIGVEGSGIALMTNQCNNEGMRLAGFDNRLLPGGAPLNNSSQAETTGKLWKTDLRGLFETSGTNISRKIREDKIRGAVIFGENPSVAPEYHHFVNNLEFLVVADLFLTETAQAADVFLPISAFMETDGHFTNWSGLQQRTHAIGDAANGLQTMEIIKRLALLMGNGSIGGSFDEIGSEFKSLLQVDGAAHRVNGSFPTEDGKAHFALYSDQSLSTSAETATTIEIDARMATQMKLIRA
jgi:predicted molibdopterin-dependent oxidoreductase YjgC